MEFISTRDAAKRLKIHFTTLAQYIAKGKLPAPTIIEVGSRTTHAWTEQDLEAAKKLLPKIKNGRKMRHQKTKTKKNPAAIKSRAK
ncbi:MAG TPA: hypothetical protein VG759_00760 [Candidatus Angelobacter sp.]|jgi:predicted site-specific integrase-resolvase|nr:hypothetical protein [Candidatus Angelobacter sp.]